MKILIAYYSRTGGTEKLAEVVKKEFEAQGHSVDVEKVKPVKEHSFWGWWHIRMVKGECEIQPPRIKNVAKYDAICIGSPNWTRLSLPMARYLREVEGLEYKNVGLLATTALWPSFEWYVFSAYLLDLTFSRIIENKNGRIIDAILFSTVFKNWSVDSDYGRRIIKDFCKKITSPILSYKEYLLKQKEIGGVRHLAIIVSSFLIITVFFQIISFFLGKQVLPWNQYLYLFLFGILCLFLLLYLMAKKTGFFLADYIVAAFFNIFWTITSFYLVFYLGRMVILGYVLIYVLISLSRNLRAVIYNILVASLCYLYLASNFIKGEPFQPTLDFIVIIFAGVIAYLFTRNINTNFLNLLEAQDEIEKARASLEVKVEARTKELREFTESLDEQVKEKTEELQGKIEELERFHRLAVGRELKMVALKEEIEKLKEELEKKVKK